MAALWRRTYSASSGSAAVGQHPVARLVALLLPERARVAVRPDRDGVGADLRRPGTTHTPPADRSRSWARPTTAGRRREPSTPDAPVLEVDADIGFGHVDVHRG
jgi:hypothetical protein